jgi:hypothetical protein
MDPSGVSPPANFGFAKASMPPPHIDLNYVAPVLGATVAEAGRTEVVKRVEEERRLRAASEEDKLRTEAGKRARSQADAVHI